MKKKERSFILRFLDWPATLIHHTVFVILLLGFHLPLIIATSFGAGAHRFVFNLMISGFILNLRLIGTKIVVKRRETLASDIPTLVISNHQNIYDIALLAWVFRDQHVKFVSKKELGVGIPSVSYILRKGGSVLINRKDPSQAVPAIREFGERLNSLKYTGVIFPEGTRAKDGVIKRFKWRGVTSVIESSGKIRVVPVSINGSWRLGVKNFFPVSCGNQITVEVLKSSIYTHPIELNQLESLEKQINQSLISSATSS